MAVADLTLDEMFVLEKEHPPLVGSRTSVFLEPFEMHLQETRRVSAANPKPKPGRTTASSKASAAAREKKGAAR
jgi:hypothetical protein